MDSLESGDQIKLKKRFDQKLLAICCWLLAVEMQKGGYWE